MPQALKKFPEWVVALVIIVVLAMGGVISCRETPPPQPPSVEWDKTFGGTEDAFDDVGYSVKQTSDGGYIVTGQIWSYGAGSYDVWLIKTDSSGREVWNNTFGGEGWESSNSVAQTSDGGYVIAGKTRTYGDGFDVWLIKADSGGNEIWNKTFGGADDDEGNSVAQTSDGGYIIAGTTKSYGAGGYDVWLIKTDSSGREVWNNTFGGEGWESGNSVAQTSDGGYVIAVSDGVWLIKTDPSGNEVWNKTFEGAYSDWGGAVSGWSHSVEQAADGGYIIAGGIELFKAGFYATGHSDVWLVKTDSSGNEVWNKTFGGTHNDVGNSVAQTSDGGYIIAGTTESYGAGQQDVWLIKTDSSGKEVWNNTFGGEGWECGNSVEQTSDGGYVIAGKTGTYRDGFDVWLIKVGVS